MKWMLCVCVAWSMVVAPTSAAEDLKECPSLTDEKLAELKTLVYSEDVHDKLVGDFTEVWGPKEMVDKDENTCIKSSRQKVDDKVISQTLHFKGGWFAGEKSKNGSLEKIENGIYTMKKHTGDVKGKIYTLYAKNNVFAFFACKMCKGHGPSDETKKPEDEKKQDEMMKKKKTPYWSTVSIHQEDLKTPLDEEIQKSVKEAVAIIQAHKELFGEIAEFPHPC